MNEYLIAFIETVLILVFLGIPVTVIAWFNAQTRVNKIECEDPE